MWSFFPPKTNSDEYLDEMENIEALDHTQGFGYFGKKEGGTTYRIPVISGLLDNIFARLTVILFAKALGWCCDSWWG